MFQSKFFLFWNMALSITIFSQPVSLDTGLFWSAKNLWQTRHQTQVFAHLQCPDNKKSYYIESLKREITKGRQTPRERYQTASHASLPYWGLLLLFGFAKHSEFWLRSSKAILHFPCFPTTDLQGTICTHEDKPTLHILLGQDQGTNHLSGSLFSYENWIKWAKKINLVSVSFRKPQDPGTFLK